MRFIKISRPCVLVCVKNLSRIAAANRRRESHACIPYVKAGGSHQPALLAAIFLCARPRKDSQPMRWSVAMMHERIDDDGAKTQTPAGPRRPIGRVLQEHPHCLLPHFGERRMRAVR